MTTPAPAMVGNKNGIRLWNLMAVSTDPEESKYFTRINDAAMKYGKVYFNDCVTERETKKNQVRWVMVWDAKGYKWSINTFLSPSGALEVTDRMKSPGIKETSEVIEVDVDDFLK